MPYWSRCNSPLSKPKSVSTGLVSSVGCILALSVTHSTVAAAGCGLCRHYSQAVDNTLLCRDIGWTQNVWSWVVLRGTLYQIVSMIQHWVLTVF